jgi:TPP-dependent indolepyruvate ferredoxin oxidoreductase alpha subunit
VDPEHCHVVASHPKKVDQVADILAKELAHPGVSVVIGVRECIVAARKRKAVERGVTREAAGQGADS